MNKFKLFIAPPTTTRALGWIQAREAVVVFCAETDLFWGLIHNAVTRSFSCSHIVHTKVHSSCVSAWECGVCEEVAPSISAPLHDHVQTDGKRRATMNRKACFCAAITAHALNTLSTRIQRRALGIERTTGSLALAVFKPTSSFRFYCR